MAQVVLGDVQRGLECLVQGAGEPWVPVVEFAFDHDGVHDREDLLLCFIAAFTSAFASSIGVLGALIPLAVPFLLSGNVAVTGVVIALAISVTAVDATPFSSIGALTVASAPGQVRAPLYRGLLRWGFAMVLVAPVATWLVFVVL